MKGMHTSVWSHVILLTVVLHNTWVRYSRVDNRKLHIQQLVLWSPCREYFSVLFTDDESAFCKLSGDVSYIEIIVEECAHLNVGTPKNQRAEKTPLKVFELFHTWGRPDWRVTGTFSRLFPSDHDQRLPPDVLLSELDRWGGRTVKAKPPGPHSRETEGGVSLSRKPCVAPVHGRVDWSAKYGGNRNR